MPGRRKLEHWARAPDPSGDPLLCLDPSTLSAAAVQFQFQLAPFLGASTEQPLGTGECERPSVRSVASHVSSHLLIGAAVSHAKCQMPGWQAGRLPTCSPSRWSRFSQTIHRAPRDGSGELRGAPRGRPREPDRVASPGRRAGQEG